MTNIFYCAQRMCKMFSFTKQYAHLLLVINPRYKFELARFVYGAREYSKIKTELKKSKEKTLNHYPSI